MNTHNNNHNNYNDYNNYSNHEIKYLLLTLSLSLSFLRHLCLNHHNNNNKKQLYCVKMEFQKIINLLDTISDNKKLPRFVTKKWIEAYDQSERNYSPNKEIRIKSSMLRSDLCNYSNAYIIVKGDITVTNPDNAKRNKAVTFKNNAPFINCISKINGIKIDNAEDLDVVMPMYNLLEYNKNYGKTTGSL